MECAQKREVRLRWSAGCELGSALLPGCALCCPEWTRRAYFSFRLPGARFDDGAGGDNEVQRTMLELINQLDGFDPRGNIKVLMATNRPDTLDPALMRPGRLDRKIEFSLPDLEVRKSCRFREGILEIFLSRDDVFPF